MISIHRTMLLMIVLGAVGCASMKPGRLSTHTSDPKPVDAMVDNGRVLGQLMPGLVVILEIRDNTASLVDAHVAMVPQSSVRRQEGELINITGWSNGERVTSVAIPDQRINVEEEKGLVILAERRLTAALPLPRRINRIEVQLPGDTAPHRFPVGDRIDRFCKKYPETGICRTPVESNR